MGFCRSNQRPPKLQNSPQADFPFARAFFFQLFGSMIPFVPFPLRSSARCHIAGCWHVLCFKRIRVLSRVRSDWLMPLWRGGPHASLSPVLCTIWQRGGFLLSLAGLAAFYSISSSHPRASVLLSIPSLKFRPHVSLDVDPLAAALPVLATFTFVRGNPSPNP